MGRVQFVEILEPRRLLSISLVGHTLHVTGSRTAPNAITVGLNPGGTSLFAEVSYPLRRKTFSQTKSFPLSHGIRIIDISGGNASDRITVDQTNGSFNILTRIKTLNGNDTVTGGNEPDHVLCGNGIDAVVCGNGNDTLLAGRGPDTLVGGNGDDVLRAGPGHDMLVAGNGNNTFIDPHGHVTLQGGSGHDTYDLVNIHLDPDNNYTPAKDTLETYVPPQSSDNIWNDVLNGLIDYGSFL